MSKIKKIHARQILDSRGNPTLEVDIYLIQITLMYLKMMDHVNMENYLH